MQLFDKVGLLRASCAETPAVFAFVASFFLLFPFPSRSQSFEILSPVALVPSSCEAARNVTASGITERNAKRFSEAVLDFETAVHLCPADENARIDLVQTTLDARNFGGAEVAAKSFLERNPHSEIAQIFLAYSYLMQRKFEYAGRALQKLLAQNPQNADALKLMGLTLFFYRKYSLAEKELRIALTIRPDDTSTLYALGRVYQTQDNYPAAIQCFKDLIAKKPSYYRAYDNLALCYEFLGKIAEAEAVYITAQETASRVNPDYDWPYVNHVEMLIRQDQKDAALRCAADTVRMHPRSARSQYILGKALLATNQIPDAARHLELSIELDTNFTKAHYQLARTYQRLNEPRKAQLEFARFKELSDKKQDNEP